MAESSSAAAVNTPLGLFNKCTIEQFSNAPDYKPTEKILIVGESGSGKTTLAINILFYLIKPFSSICFITPSKEDTSIAAFKAICVASNMPLYIFDIEQGIPDLSFAVFVIDDYYTSTGRDGRVETLLKTLVNRGRHKGNHVIYNAQLANRIPAEIKNNNTGVYLSAGMIADEGIWDKLNKNKPINVDESLLKEGRWFKYSFDKGKGVLVEVSWRTLYPAEIVQRMKGKSRGLPKAKSILMKQLPQADKVNKKILTEGRSYTPAASPCSFSQLIAKFPSANK